MEDGLAARMRTDLRAAMTARNTSAVGALRIALAAIANAEAVDPSAANVSAGLVHDVARRGLTAADVQDIVTHERDELHATAGEMRAIGQTDEAAELDVRAAVLDSYLHAGRS